MSPLAGDIYTLPFVYVRPSVRTLYVTLPCLSHNSQNLYLLKLCNKKSKFNLRNNFEVLAKKHFLNLCFVQASSQ